MSPAAGDFRGDLPSLAGPVRRTESRRRQGAEELETENAWRKRIVADKVLQIEALMGAGAGKLVRPARRRRAIEHLQRVFGVPQRWACQPVGQYRSTQRHQPAEPDRDPALRAEMRRVSRQQVASR